MQTVTEALSRLAVQQRRLAARRAALRLQLGYDCPADALSAGVYFADGPWEGLFRVIESDVMARGHFDLPALMWASGITDVRYYLHSIAYGNRTAWVGSVLVDPSTLDADAIWRDMHPTDVRCPLCIGHGVNRSFSGGACPRCGGTGRVGVT